MKRPIRPSALSFVALFLLSGCGYFTGQPPLPRHAAIESAVIPAGEAKFAALVQNADVIYFPSESVGSSGRYEAAWKLVEALQRDGGSFAIGWDAIGGEEQPLLDRWAKEKGAAGVTIPTLRLHGSAGEAEICRKFLQELVPLNVQILALRPPSEPKTATTEAPEAALRAEQFSASAVARYIQANGGEKMLVFLHRARLGRDHGVPHLVGQKVRVRQLVLDSRAPRASSARLLAGGLLRDGLRGGGSLEIVNGSPIAFGDFP